MRTLTLGYDGSPESRAAADWAAEEALRGGQALKLVFAWDYQPYSLTLMDAETERRFVEELPLRGAAELAKRYPGLEVAGERATGPPAEALLVASRDSDMLVLGSRALGGMHGFLIGSVAQSAVARSDHPVALVRVPAPLHDVSETGPTPPPPPSEQEVILGVGHTAENDALFALSFEAAARRGQTLRIVHCWRLPAPAAADTSILSDDRKAALVREEDEWLQQTVRPWSDKYPEVKVFQDAHAGRPAEYLAHLSHRASVMLVGRRNRPHGRPGPHIGHVAHSVMHHAAAPVVVVPEH
ncbi:universal stress protein [Streptomyces sp. NPDC059740]|uniref:universal stress protein n=1 Tax=Streptomyces sp. NPDC059740 TaxID=3346926 RepID=UPI0036635836